MPTVVNLSGRKGVMPEGAIYVGRASAWAPWRLRASKWANPFSAKIYGRDEAIRLYREWLCYQPDLLASLHELRGHDLACWCAPEPCHAEVLLEMANAP